MSTKAYCDAAEEQLAALYAAVEGDFSTYSKLSTSRLSRTCRSSDAKMGPKPVASCEYAKDAEPYPVTG